ncbi:MAG: hypothetical protein DI533_13790 [Cereibacter sphaeroides]|uniref:Uncharacterized protein n=1 Tax=Cereibacter sphaeroides TaxID=1063 RepID=A0A2W5S994_CERSP|nr:MAG: hypothetical protein DI533_13790 [Cereibacter sphaeroides]
MRKTFRVLGWLLLGLLVGGGLTILGAVAAAYAFDISQFEGAHAMGVAFFWTPLGALTGAIVGAVIGARRGGAAQ